MSKPRQAPPKPAPKTATDRELEVLAELVKGFSDLDSGAHHRALNWAWQRYVSAPAQQMDAVADGLRALSGMRR